MKQTAIILLAGLLAAAAGFSILYFRGTSQQREVMSARVPELAWLKKEFGLADGEFDRISKLHEGYMPRCEELCRRIAEKNSELQQLLAATNLNRAGIEQKLREAGELRIECQQNMFNHFLDVSRAMPEAQGRRYLQWIQERTLSAEQDMAQHHGGHQMMGHQ